MTSTGKPKTVVVSRRAARIVKVYLAFCLVLVIGINTLANVHRVAEGRLSLAGFIESLVLFLLRCAVLTAMLMGLAWLWWKRMNLGARLVLERKGRPAGTPGPGEEPEAR
jgi:hypothetical protein